MQADPCGISRRRFCFFERGFNHGRQRIWVRLGSRDRFIVNKNRRRIFYSNHCAPSLIELDDDKVKAWLGKGALPTEAVARLIKVKGIS